MICLLSNAVLAQEYAEFMTSINRQQRHFGKDKDKFPKSMTESVWFINGQKMFFGCKPVKVRVNPNKLDTIIYNGYRQRKSDTILCNISEAKQYIFHYNECCGGFNIQDGATKQYFKGRVIFQVKQENNQTYLGTLGEAGVLLQRRKSDTLKVGCRSAMSPNVYPISLSTIELCKEGLDCNEEFCLQTNDNLQYDFRFKIQSKKLDVLFMPLKFEPLVIVYDSDLGWIDFR